MTDEPAPGQAGARGEAATDAVEGSSTDRFERLIDAALRSLPSLPPRTYRYEHDEPERRALDATLLAEAARDRGLQVTRLSSLLQIISSDTRSLGFLKNMCQTLTSLDRLVSNDKELTKRVLASNGLPVADGQVVRSANAAKRAARRIGGPVVIKPLTGSGGKGITVDVRSDSEVADAAREARARNRRYLVEESIPSIDLRIMVIAGRAVAAMLRVPAHVTGDGEASITELVERKNEFRYANPYLRHSPIVLDDVAMGRLAERGLTPGSVPEAGRRVFLHYKANLSSGGDGIAVTGDVHPELLRLAERAAACFPSAHHCGVDILAERFDAAPGQQRCVVCEVNCNNDMPMHEFPLYGTPVPAAELEIDGYFGSGSGQLPTAGSGTKSAGRRGLRAMVAGRLRGAWQALPTRMPATSQQANVPLPRPEELRELPPRQLDRDYLARALQRHGLRDARVAATLIHGKLADHAVVLERSGRSVFAARLGSDRPALECLLQHAEVPITEQGDAARDTDRARQRPDSRQHTWRLLLIDGEVRASLTQLADTTATTPIDEEGATVGHRGRLDRALVRRARAVVALLGHPPLVAVSFAWRHTELGPTWAVSTVDTDPPLAPFAFPTAGHAFDVYDDLAAAIMRSRPRRILGRANGGTGAAGAPKGG
ncbi:acetate--CoA ligase family protein [Haloechinothrix sp. LS1_15]|uniref:ATP-grasp domain-containing protein n=1 Tax=Haloechinothrix sp. LS1_15 TaxID=2652248 RepID=UPI0029482AC7|nr:acetate--CoA ligase family protein [Haloechinothrix sp. LS1_15]MDV6011075.1 ATP-grasp domain-containing protein [Haloechinothrix sp. LS1_15]